MFLRVSRAGLELALRVRLTAARRHTRVDDRGVRARSAAVDAFHFFDGDSNGDPRPTLEYERALAENARYAAQFDRSSLPMPPGRRLAVLACMDARLTVEDVLGLQTGDAHIIRNAGGLATEDALRSLVISHHLLGTEEFIVIKHTGCGMLTFQDSQVLEKLVERTGQRRRPPLPRLPGPRVEPARAGRAGSARTRGSRTCRCTAWSTRSRTGRLREVV